MIKALLIIIIFFLSGALFFPYDIFSYYVKNRVNRELNIIRVTRLDISPFKITADVKHNILKEQTVILIPSYFNKTVSFKDGAGALSGSANINLKKNIISISGNLNNFEVKDDFQASAEFQSEINFKTFKISNSQVSNGKIKGNLNTPFGEFSGLTGDFNLSGNSVLNGFISIKGENYNAEGNIVFDFENLNNSRINFSSINYEGQELSNISLNLTDLL